MARRKEIMPEDEIIDLFLEAEDILTFGDADIPDAEGK